MKWNLEQRKNEAGVDFVMSFKKKKKCLSDFIFSGTVGCECTEETYALVKSWLPERKDAKG